MMASHRVRLLAAAAMATALLVGCKPKPPAPKPAPPVVTVAKPVRKTVTDYAQFTGRTEAIESVHVRPRVSGFLQKVCFQDGAAVKKGQLLFAIDPAPFQATVNQAKADLVRKQAALKNAEWEYKSKKELYDKGDISQKELINAVASRDQAAADVASGRASLQSAELNLGYTQVKAPISGHVSRRFVDVGNLVTEAQTVLASIVNDQPIYAYFNLNERDYLTFKQEPADKVDKKGRPEPPPAELALQTDKGFPHKGKLDYASNKMDPNTGTIQIRGVFPNKDRLLIPGLFCRVRLAIRKRPDALLVPDTALSQDQQGKYLLIVNAKNTVERENVRAGALFDGKRVILEGLKPDDRVIVNGLQRVRPGFACDPKTEAEMKATGKPSSAAGSGPKPADAAPKDKDSGAKPRVKPPAKASATPGTKATK